MGATEADLLAEARRGDPRALEALLDRHQRRVFRFGLRMCGDEESAKDVVQETLLAAARGIREFRGGSSLSTWLYTIARSFCVKARRTSKFAPARVESLEGSPEATRVPDAARGPEDHVAGRQVEAALRDAIAALEPMYRETLVLRDVEGLSAPEVAQIMGVSVEAVKSRLHRARLAVRERLAPVLGVGPQAEGPPREGCPDVLELLSRKVEGELSGSVCAEVERHLEGCDTCRARCDSLRASLALCSRAAETPLPAGVERSVRAALRRAIQRNS
jgi:RNA polymerase sigma-70 factor (ECF subfamily)